VKPLDGGALSLAGNALAGEGTPSGTATYPPPGRHGQPPSSLWPHGCSLDLARCGAREEGEEQKKEGRKEGGACRGCAPGGAAPHRRRSLPVTGLTALSSLEARHRYKGKEEHKEKERGERRRRPLAGRRSVSPSPVGAPGHWGFTRRLCARETGEEKEEMV
jgi:hypothetical protein